MARKENSPWQAMDYAAALQWSAFLTSSAKLVFPAPEKPVVSIVLVLYNRAELTYQCLLSILATVQTPMEVVVYDNASTDLTAALLQRLENVVIIRGDQNIGYVQAANRAVKVTRGKYLLLLNNDTQLISGAIETGLENLDSDPTIGGVGARLILPDGTLQEAGSIVWSDGSCAGYCRGQHVEHFEAMFHRTVDFCSAAYWLVRRQDFLRFGGFDERFSPAYYEEVDLCLRMKQAGLRQVYDPRIVVLHYEFASSQSAEAAIQLQMTNRSRFAFQHRKQLAQQHSPVPQNFLTARTPAQRSQRILMIEDWIPHQDLGAGFPRSNLMLHILVELGCEVTLFPMTNQQEDWSAAYRDLPRSVEIVQGKNSPALRQFLKQRSQHYGAWIVSRPHNMQKLNALLKRNPQLLAGTKLIYDAEAIFALRDFEKQRLAGENVPEQVRQHKIQQELQLAESADAVLTVSAGEAKLFRERKQTVHVLSHALSHARFHPAITGRSGLLFVGAVHSEQSPNAQSLRWLCEQILPAIQARTGKRPFMTIAGTMLEQTQNYCRKRHCEVLGRVEDLSEVYQLARVFVAPTQFAAGIPLKVIEAAAHGVPVVATSLLAKQLGWVHERELLVADTPADFAECCVKLLQNDWLWHSLQKEALQAIARDYSQSAILETLQTVLGIAAEQPIPARQASAA